MLRFACWVLVARGLIDASRRVRLIRTNADAAPLQRRAANERPARSTAGDRKTRRSWAIESCADGWFAKTPAISVVNRRPVRTNLGDRKTRRSWAIESCADGRFVKRRRSRDAAQALAL